MNSLNNLNIVNTNNTGTTVSLKIKEIINKKINILGHEVKVNDSLFNNIDFKIIIANLNFNGWKYWKCIKDTGINFDKETERQIERIIIIEKRKEIIKEIKNK